MKSVTPIDKNLELDELSSSDEIERSRSLKTLLGEVKQRRVCRAAITYVLVMWLNLQIGDVLFPMIGLPAWSLKLIVILGAMGFPAVLLLAWVFQVTPRGIEIDRSDAQQETAQSGPLDRTISVLLLLFSFFLTLLLIADFASEQNTATAARSAVVRDIKVHAATANSQRMENLARSIEAEVRHRVVNLEGVLLAPNDNQYPASAEMSIIISVSRVDTRYHMIVQLLNATTAAYISSHSMDVEVPESVAPASHLADSVMASIDKRSSQSAFATSDQYESASLSTGFSFVT